MIIDFETHFYPKEYISKLRERNVPPRFVLDSQQGLVLEYDAKIRIPRQKLYSKFTDVETRQRDMVRDGIDMQVLSVPLPGADKLEPDASVKTCAAANDELANICQAHQTKFCGLALLPIQAGEAAADELRRAVNDLGLKGGYLHSSSNDSYLDSKECVMVLNVADKLGVPIFVHPTIPHDHKNMEQHRLASTFGLQMDLSLSLLRLVFSSDLESLPNLKLVVSHLGSTLSFISNRIDDEFEFAKSPETKILRKPSEYIKGFFVDTVTMDSRPLEFAEQYFGSDHMVFGSDYPFWDTSLHVKAVEDSSLSSDDKDRIYSKTATGLLKL
ncbi:MAG: amidohydrolase family protein [Nitrososphaerota archaeon]|nr:amidohydrolase family protein [Nitrososphaerota archaeon]